MSRKHILLLILFHASFFLALSVVGNTVKSAPDRIVTVKNQPNDRVCFCDATVPACVILKNERSQDVFRIAGNKAIHYIPHTLARIEKQCPASKGHKIKRHLAHNYPSHNFW